MSKGTKLLSRVFIWALVLVIVLAVKDNIVVHADEKGDDGWKFYWSANDNYTISIDKNAKYGDSPYSVKIENTDFNFAGIEKRFKLKPDTQYRVSVMVKYSGYEAKKDDEPWGKGAHFRVHNADSLMKDSQYYYSDEWGKISETFTTDSTGDIIIRLINGGYCKGTAWFCDFRLEEVAETTDQWNVLVLIIKSIDSDVIVDGKNSHYTGAYSEEDIKFIKSELPKQLKYQLPRVSDGLIGINDIDIYVPELVLKELKTYDPNAVDPYNEDLSKVLDKYLAKKQYQQIILIPPFKKGINVWQGKGGNKYKGINYCQYIFYPGDKSLLNGKEYEEYVVSGYIHEILHGVERDSKSINSTTPTFHENVGIYKDYYSSETDGWFSYHHDYITGNLPDGRGIDKSVLYRPSVYMLVTDDLTPSKDLGVNETLPTHISEVATVGKIKSVTYKGKAVKPSVKVAGLEKGTDYIVSYADNNDIGKGKVIINGKGKYTGTIEVPFTIKMKTPIIKVKGSKLKWRKIKGADGYEVYYNKDGGKYEKLADVNKNQYSLSIFKSGSYTFKIRAYARTNAGLEYSSRTKEVTVVFK